MNTEILISSIGALGGFELVKLLWRWLTRRKTDSRIAEAEADASEFNVLRGTIEFLQVQLDEKEKRFAEQTQLVRRLNTEVLDLTHRLAAAERELLLKRCDRLQCTDRQPPTTYTPWHEKD